MILYLHMSNKPDTREKAPDHPAVAFIKMAGIGHFGASAIGALDVAESTWRKDFVRLLKDPVMIGFSSILGVIAAALAWRKARRQDLPSIPQGEAMATNTEPSEASSVASNFRDRVRDSTVSAEAGLIR